MIAKKYILSIKCKNGELIELTFDNETKVIEWLLDADFRTHSRDENGHRIFINKIDSYAEYHVEEEKEEYFILRFVIGAERLKEFKKEEILGCMLSEQIQADVIVWVKLNKLSDIEKFSTKFYSNDQFIAERDKGGFYITKILGKTNNLNIPMEYDAIREEY